MAAPLLAELLGGNPFMGFIAAVAFATILAVVSGLTLAAASAMAHDIYLNVFKGGKSTEKEQVKVAKIATVIFGVIAILTGIAFKGQNVAYMVGLTFAIACSGPFPAIFLSIVWKKLTTWGAVCGHCRRLGVRRDLYYPQSHGLGGCLKTQRSHLPLTEPGYFDHDPGLSGRLDCFYCGA